MYVLLHCFVEILRRIERLIVNRHIALRIERELYKLTRYVTRIPLNNLDLCTSIFTTYLGMLGMLCDIVSRHSPRVQGD